MEFPIYRLKDLLVVGMTPVFPLASIVLYLCIYIYSVDMSAPYLKTPQSWSQYMHSRD